MSAYTNPTAEQLHEELQQNLHNDHVGHTLLFENDKVKVWHITLQPGERIHYHRHNYDYFWTVLQDGVGLSNQLDGSQVHLTFSKKPDRILEYQSKRDCRARFAKYWNRNPGVYYNRA